MTKINNIKGTFFTEAADQLLKDKLPTIKQRLFSDVIDDEGHQYIDLVMEGGGTLGVALLGYIYVLEQAGIRFIRMGGTSAGSIVALLLASENAETAKSDWIVEAIANKKFIDFVDLANGDGKDNATALVNLLTGNDSWFIKLFKDWKLIDNIYQIIHSDHEGFAKGNNFKNWMIELLQDKKINSLKELEEVRKEIPKGFRLRSKKRQNKILFNKILNEGSLAIIATEVTTETKFEFPRQADLVWENIKDISPAEFVRASMSIPLFFEPVRVSTRKLKADKEKVERWKSDLKYNGEIGDDLVFVDGGMVSNFPINIFHKNKVPIMPTFGIKLSGIRDNINSVSTTKDFLYATLNTARHALDYDFIYKNKDYDKIVKPIKIDSDISWLNFDMDQETQLKLFIAGTTAAIEFLEEFDWEAYKKLRAELISKKEN